MVSSGERNVEHHRIVSLLVPAVTVGEDALLW